MTSPIRLAKRLIEITHRSYREAELYIAGGWVMVVGHLVEEPQFMVSDQFVTLHPDANLRTCLRSVARGRQRDGAQKPQFTRVNANFEQRIRPDHGIAVRS